MRFRPCIDIHGGRVKQLVGESLSWGKACENFVAANDSGYFARLYKDRGLYGGHIILLDRYGSEEYALDKEQAMLALREFDGGLQVGGGITPENACDFLDSGASHVIVTSYVFSGGEISFDRLERMVSAVGKDRLVLDLSCKKSDGRYLVATDRWSRLTRTPVSTETLVRLSGYCDELLVHAVDVEGKQCGIDSELAGILSSCPVSCTYAGGIRSAEDIGKLEELGRGRIDFTVGSALDIFGGDLSFEELARDYGA